MTARAANHTCVRFVRCGQFQFASLTIDVGGQKTETSGDRTAWRCRDCGELVWLKTGIDPNDVKQTAALKSGSRGRSKKN